MDELKRKYNQLLAREKKGEEWLDSPERTPQEIEKGLVHFKAILREIERLLIMIGPHTYEEAVHGFKEGEHA